MIKRCDKWLAVKLVVLYFFALWDCKRFVIIICRWDDFSTSDSTSRYEQDVNDNSNLDQSISVSVRSYGGDTGWLRMRAIRKNMSLLLSLFSSRPLSSSYTIRFHISIKPNISYPVGILLNSVSRDTLIEPLWRTRRNKPYLPGSICEHERFLFFAPAPNP